MANREMFVCPACGHGLFVCVSIKRQDKPAYETEFIACSRCKVMQWSPGNEPKNKQPPPLLRTWGKGDPKK
jgi:transcription elongation factor Elf1